MSDVELKNKGNKLFQARKFEEAIKCYTGAITKKPNVAIYYTNRALSYLKLKRWDMVVPDCRIALELDPTISKAHYFLGQSLLETECYDEGITHLQRAYDLSKEQKVNYGDDIAYLLRYAKKKRFSIAEDKRICQEIELQIFHNERFNLQSHLKKLLLDERERQIAKALEISDENKVKEEISNAEKQCDTYIHEVHNLFAKVDERRRKREVPDYLCGKISFEVLKDPVITPSGITYDRKALEEHLQRVGYFDPVTRTSLTASQLIPNLAMKEVVDAFICENEWALHY